MRQAYAESIRANHLLNYFNRIGPYAPEHTLDPTIAGPCLTSKGTEKAGHRALWHAQQPAASGVEPKAGPAGQNPNSCCMKDREIDAGEPGGSEPPRRLSGGRRGANCARQCRAICGRAPQECRERCDRQQAGTGAVVDALMRSMVQRRVTRKRNCALTARKARARREARARFGAAATSLTGNETERGTRATRPVYVRELRLPTTPAYRGAGPSRRGFLLCRLRGTRGRPLARGHCIRQEMSGLYQATPHRALSGRYLRRYGCNVTVRFQRKLPTPSSVHIFDRTLERSDLTTRLPQLRSFASEPPEHHQGLLLVLSRRQSLATPIGASAIDHSAKLMQVRDEDKCTRGAKDDRRQRGAARFVAEEGEANAKRAAPPE